MADSIEFLKQEIEDLKMLGESWNMEKYQIEEAIMKAIEGKNEMVNRDVDKSKQNYCKNCLMIIFVLSTCTILLFLLGTFAYNNSTSIEIYVNNLVGDLQYPVLRRWRLLFLPLHRYFDLQSFSNRECLVDNPWYAPEEVDCEGCQDVEDVEVLDKVTDFNNEYSGLGPLIVTDVFPYAAKNYTVDKFMKFYEANKEYIDVDLCEVSTLNNTINTIGDYYKLLKNSREESPNIRWKICYGEGLRILRKFLPRPYFISTEGGLEKFLMIVNTDSEVLPVPTGQYANAWLAQVTGISELELKPVADCNSTCHGLNVTLNKGEVMYLNQELWDVDIVDNPSDEPAITLLSSFA